MDNEGIKDNKIEDEEAVLAALERYKKENKKFREERDAAQARVQELEGDDSANKWKRRTIEAEAKNRLIASGIKDSDRLMKYLDVENVEVDDDGNLKGLDDAIDGMKKDFPELFDPKRQVGGKADGFANDEANAETSTSELQAQRLLSRTG